MKKLFASSLFTLGMIAASAHAGILGNSINASYSVPSFSVLDDAGTVTATVGGTLLDYDEIAFTISDNDILVSFNYETGYGAGSFVGYVFKNLNQSFPSEYRLTSTTNALFDASRLATQGNTFSLNLASLDFEPTDSLVLTLSPLAAVPEPESYAMLLAGLGWMGCIARRKRSRRHAVHRAATIAAN